MGVDNENALVNLELIKKSGTYPFSLEPYPV